MLACLCQIGMRSTAGEGEVSEISASIAQIEQEYRQALQKSDGDSKRQIQAKQQYQEKLGQLGKKYFPKLESIKSEKDLSSLALAFEAGEQPVQAQTVIDRLLLLHPNSRQGHKSRVRHYANHATADEALKALTRSQNALSAQDMKPLLPYWGVLGFKFANENRPKTSLDCFKRYLESRYEVAKASAEPLPVLPVIFGKARDQYLVLGDQQAYRDCVKECQSRLDQIASDWKSDSKPKDARLVWQFHYQVLSIFLAGELENKDPLTGFTQLIELSFKNKQWASERADFLPILVHGTDYAIEASHNWKNIEADIVFSSTSKVTENSVESDKLAVFSAQIETAIAKVRAHRQSLMKIKSVARKLKFSKSELPETILKTFDSGCMVCLAQNPLPDFFKIRSQLSQISLQHPVVACVSNEDERKSLLKLLRMLPKPIEKADLPFRIQVAVLPQELLGTELPAGEVFWLMVKDLQVVDYWLGTEESKVAQMIGELMSETD